jgi:flagellar biosynthetic protein FliR
MSPISRFPGMVRLILLLTLTVAITNIVVDDWALLTQPNWLISIGLEWSLGLLMLLGFQLAYAAIQIMGRVLDMQIGFAAAGVIDPITSNNDPLIGTMLTLFITLAVFLTNTHHAILGSLIDTFTLIPPGAWDGNFNFSNIMGFFSAQLIFALLLLGPVVMGLWLLDIFNGFIAKTMPQMNVYFVMLPLKIGVGIFLLSVIMEAIRPLVRDIFAAIVGWFNLGWVS